MDKHVYAARRERVRELMRQKGLDAFLVSLDANRYYLSGFELHDHQTNESSGYVIVTKSGPDWLCTDARYYDAVLRLWDEAQIFIYTGVASAATQINELLKDKIKGKVGFESQCLNVDFYEKVSPGLTLERADGLVESLRLIKDPEEISRMERSCALNHKLMQWLPGVLAHGRTEQQIAWDVEQFYRNHGASALSFNTIVGIGPNAALPHAIPGKTAVHENCCVLVDCGCRLDDYCSDQTRSFWVGDKPAPHFLTALELVKEAQNRAIKGIRPGTTAKEAYQAAWSYFESRGVEKYFTHALGHGIGLQTHEPPSLNPRVDFTLRPGMIVTVEPGLYYPHWGGIRWEYMVLVTEDGARVL